MFIEIVTSNINAGVTAWLLVSLVTAVTGYYCHWLLLSLVTAVTGYWILAVLINTLGCPSCV